jgi:hypothetical protein
MDRTQRVLYGRDQDQQIAQPICVNTEDQGSQSSARSGFVHSGYAVPALPARHRHSPEQEEKSEKNKNWFFILLVLEEGVEPYNPLWCL